MHNKELEQANQQVECLMDSMKDCISDAHLEIHDVLKKMEQPIIPDLRYVIEVIELTCHKVSDEVDNMMTIVKYAATRFEQDPIQKLKKNGKFKKVDFESGKRLNYFQILDSVETVHIDEKNTRGEPRLTPSNAWMLTLTKPDTVEIFEYETANIRGTQPQQLIPVFRQKFSDCSDIDEIRGEIVAATTPGITSSQDHDVIAFIVEPISTKFKVIWLSKKQQINGPSVQLRSLNGHRELTLSLEFDMLAPRIVSVPDWDVFENKAEASESFKFTPRRLMVVPTGLLSLLSGPRLIIFIDISSPLNYSKEDSSPLCTTIMLKKSKPCSADVVDINYYITYSSNFDKNAPPETLFYILHKDQDYTELSIILNSQTDDDRLIEKFKTTRRLVDIYPTETGKRLIFTTSIHRFHDWIIISGRFGS